jgi:hypothetical protein
MVTGQVWNNLFQVIWFPAVTNLYPELLSSAVTCPTRFSFYEVRIASTDAIDWLRFFVHLSNPSIEMPESTSSETQTLPPRSVSFHLLQPSNRSRDSAFGIATGYGLDDRGVGVRVPVISRIFSSPRRLERLWGPPNLLSNGFRGVKWPGREADHSPPTSSEAKTCVDIYIHSPIRLHGIVLN